MNKVLMAFDGERFSKGVFDFVSQMNIRQKVLATGIFLPSLEYAELLYSFGGVPAGPMYINEVADTNVVQKNKVYFKELCVENGLEFRIHTDTGQAVKTIVDETLFADLLVLSSKSFYENLGIASQEEYIANVLHKSECPVVLVPEEYKYPKSIIIAYDGSEQSVFALKQFAYLFPEFYELKVMIVHFETGDEDVPDREHIEEFASLYYKDLSIFSLKIGSKSDLEQWLHDFGATLLVTGAFGRSLFSEAIKKSFISKLIRDHEIPVFVAHR